MAWSGYDNDTVKAADWFSPSPGQYKYYTFEKDLSCDGCEENDMVTIIDMWAKKIIVILQFCL